MARKHRRREFELGGYFHVYSRGLRRRTIFRDDVDREAFFSAISEAVRKRGHAVAVNAYALMGNHFHMVVRSADSTAERFIMGLLSSYARAFNARHGTEGKLFDDRHYGSRRIRDDADLMGAITYTHLNPRTRQLRSKHTSDPVYRGDRAGQWWLDTAEPRATFDRAGGYGRFVAGTEWLRTARAAARRG